MAAKQLFDALRASGINPEEQVFDNVFLPTPDGDATISLDAVKRIRCMAGFGIKVVAMGKLVSAALWMHGIEHIEIVHPAARGRIRKKAAYAAHVRSVLF